MYIAAFEWTETDESTTPLSHSQILPMVSNKRQDYQQTRWHLSQHYPKFVDRSPASAARAMIAVVAAYCRDRDIESHELGKALRKELAKGLVGEAVEALLDEEPSGSDEDLHTFIVDGHGVSLKEDRSGIWEGGVSSHDEAIQILDSFFRHLDVLASQEKMQDLAEQLIRLVMCGNQQAVVWRRLLALLAKHPQLAQRLKGLADAEPLMLADDTRKQFALFIKTLYPLLSIEERYALEERILGLTEEGEADEEKIRQDLSDKLLSTLGDVELVTEAAQSRLASLRGGGSRPNIRSTPTFSGFGQLTPDKIDRMHHRGGTPRNEMPMKASGQRSNRSNSLARGISMAYQRWKKAKQFWPQSRSWSRFWRVPTNPGPRRR